MNWGARRYCKGLAALFIVYAGALGGCHDDLVLYVPPEAAPPDATVSDAHADVGTDAPVAEDATLDSPPDVVIDTGTPDTGTDAGVDSGADTGVDANDAGADVGADADDGATDASDDGADADDGAG